MSNYSNLKSPVYKRYDFKWHKTNEFSIGCFNCAANKQTTQYQWFIESTLAFCWRYCWSNVDKLRWLNVILHIAPTLSAVVHTMEVLCPLPNKPCQRNNGNCIQGKLKQAFRIIRGFRMTKGALFMFESTVKCYKGKIGGSRNAVI